MRTFRITLAYDGTSYAGWQVQPGQPTVQATLEAALAKITGAPVHAAASGRTDSGVHALGQVVSFDSATALAPLTIRNALNAELPRDIAALEVCQAPDRFHARRHCIRKRYRYLLHDGEAPDVFLRQYCWQYRHRLDAATMQRAAQLFVGTHDFRSFESRWPQRSSSVRTIYSAEIARDRPDQPGRIAMEFCGNGFLYNMVRAMVGTLVEVGRGAKPIRWPAEVVAAGDRGAAGMTAPAQGLYLVSAEYPEAAIGSAESPKL